MSINLSKKESVPIILLDSKSQSNLDLVNLRSGSTTPHEIEESYNQQLNTTSTSKKQSQKSPQPSVLSISLNICQKLPKCSFNAAQCRETMKYTCFSCCFMGNIITEFEREEKFKCMESCSYCQECAMGSHGCHYCASMCCLVGLGWPLSPCFSCYLLRERWKIHLFYPHDTRFPPASTISDYCFYYCCWMKNLRDQHQFIQQLKKEGNLTFHWDYTLYHDQLPRKKFHSISPYKSYTLLIFGPNTSLKQQFIRKLLIQTNNQQLSSLKEQYPLLNDIHYIQTGIRTIVNDYTNEINFLEIWDIPINHFQSSFISHMTNMKTNKEIENNNKIFVSIYLFDMNDYEHFQDMKNIFNQYESIVNKPRMIIILKDPTNTNNINNSINNTSLSNLNTHSIYNLNQNSTENLLNNLSNHSIDKIALEAEILTWAKRQGVLWYHVNVYDEYSYLILNKQIMKLIPKHDEDEN